MGMAFQARSLPRIRSQTRRSARRRSKSGASGSGRCWRAGAFLSSRQLPRGRRLRPRRKEREGAEPVLRLGLLASCASNRFAYVLGLRAARHAATAKTAATADRIAATDALDIASRPPLDCSEDSCWFAVPAFVLIVATSRCMVVIFPFSDSRVAVTVPSVVWTVATFPLMLVIFPSRAARFAVKVPMLVEIVAVSPWIDSSFALTAVRSTRIVPVSVLIWAMSPWIATTLLYCAVSVWLTRNVARPEPDPVKNVSETLA